MEVCGSQTSVPGTGVSVIDDVSEIKDDLLVGPEECEIMTHIFDIRPDDAVLRWFGSRCTPDFGVIQEHQGQSVELSTSRGNREILSMQRYKVSVCSKNNEPLLR